MIADASCVLVAADLNVFRVTSLCAEAKRQCEVGIAYAVYTSGGSEFSKTLYGCQLNFSDIKSEPGDVERRMVSLKKSNPDGTAHTLDDGVPDGDHPRPSE